LVAPDPRPLAVWQAGPAPLGQARGNIGAAILLTALWFFRRSAGCQNKIPASIAAEEEYCSFVTAIPREAVARYIGERIHL
jgi:hypothetical protein